MRFVSQSVALLATCSLLTSAASTSKTSSKSTSTTKTTTKTSAKSSTKSTTLKTTTSSAVASTSAVPTSTTSLVPTSSSTVASPTLSAPSDVCFVTAYAAVPAATAACTAITLSNVNVPGNSTLNLSKLKAGTVVTFDGLTTFDYADADYDMIKVGGTDITITSTPGAVIDGNGQAWWDGLGSNGGKTKPDHFFVVSKALGTSYLENLYIQNWPTHAFSITGSTGLTIQNITLNNTAGDAPNSISDGKAAAHNSDGFDLSSDTNVILRDSVVLNQDDCVAITSGDHITVSNLYCDGGHGLSIGSEGGKSNNNVTNILFENSRVLNSQNGARIKSNSGTTGYIANITYQNIDIQNATIYGVDIQQDYLNGGPTGEPTNGVIITGITLTNVTGTATDDGINYYILCGDGSCSDFTFNDVHISGGGDPSSCNLQPVGDFVCSP